MSRKTIFFHAIVLKYAILRTKKKRLSLKKSMIYNKRRVRKCVRKKRVKKKR